MLVTATCHSLIGSGLKPGIAKVWQSEGETEELPFSRSGTDVLVKSTTLTQNQAPARGDVLIAIYPPRIRLTGQILAPDLNFWSGGECLQRDAIWRSKKCQGVPRRNWAHDRYEVFLVFPEEMLVVCDRENRVSVITLEGSGPELKVPDAEQVVDYLYKTGQRQSGYRGVEWALRNIEVIAKHHKLDVTRKRRDLEAKLQAFPVKGRK